MSTLGLVLFQTGAELKLVLPLTPFFSSPEHTIISFQQRVSLTAKEICTFMDNSDLSITLGTQAWTTAFVTCVYNLFAHVYWGGGGEQYTVSSEELYYCKTNTKSTQLTETEGAPCRQEVMPILRLTSRSDLLQVENMREWSPLWALKAKQISQYIQQKGHCTLT